MKPPMIECVVCRGEMRRTRDNSERVSTRDKFGNVIDVIKVKVYCTTCLEQHLSHGFTEETFHASWVSFRTDGKPGDLYLHMQAEKHDPTRDFVMIGKFDGID